MTAPSLGAAPRTYWRESQTPRYSLLFALPLFIGYEGLALSVGGERGSQIRNGADVMLQEAFYALLGPRGPLLFEVLLIALGIALVLRDMRRRGGTLSRGIFLGMLGEAVVLAMACGVVVGSLTSHLMGAAGLALGPLTNTPTSVRLMLSLGAGLYEELLFRVIIVGTLAWGGHRLLGWGTTFAGVFAVVVGAILFSAMHYVGPYGDRLTVFSFTYRALAGVFFSALYLLRGFGITAWTHALYDIFVLVF